MNRLLLLNLLLLFCIALQGQNEVVIDGVTFSTDRKTLISYPRDKADQEYVVPEGTEVIGERSFVGNTHLKVLNLPLSLKAIEDWAISSNYLTSVTWHTYPKIMGRNVFAYSSVTEFNVSEDSDNCISIDGILFSKDRKTLLLFPRGKVIRDKYEVPNGIEVIATGAFEGGQMDEIILPSSLVRIEDHAFWMTERIPTRYGYRCVSWVTCNAIIPPIIIGNPFATTEYISLSVPENSFDLYCNTPYWQDFHSINGIIGAGDSSLEVASSNTKIWTQSQILYLESEKEIEEVKIYNINGICTWNETINSRKWQFVTTELPVGLFLIEVVTIDGDKEIYKFSKL